MSVLEATTGAPVEDPAPSAPAPEASPTPEASPAPAPLGPELSGIFSGDKDNPGTFAENWTEKLPDDTMGEYKAMLAQHNSLEGLAKSYKDWMTTARSKTEGMVKVPGEEATPEEIAAWNEARGVPADVSGYEIKRPEIIDESDWNPEEVQGFAGFAHEIGLTPEQAQKLVEFNAQSGMEMMNQEESTISEQLESEREKLREAWGDNYDRKAMDAKRVLAARGIDPNHPMMKYADSAQFVADMFQFMGEDNVASAADLGGVASAREQLDKLMASPAYRNGEESAINSAIALQERVSKHGL